MIFIITFVFIDFDFIFMVNKVGSFTILIFIVLCRFSKRAQFPLSSWLPAAMSAPTPISAIVHSSTLVTAGIFFVINSFFYFEIFNFNIFFSFFRLATFIMGGLFCVIESDFKKVVAFSTISQIRILMFFLFNSFLFTCLMHIIFHAFFKTLIFVSSGLLFSSIYSAQLKSHFKRSSSNYFYRRENRSTFQTTLVQYSELLNSMNFKDKFVLIIRRQVLSTFGSDF